jgi:NAD(P)-dependent dehydrogenase (short-subunit alcohol dehydrogenase family)
MTGRLAGKVAIVTGATAGIGEAVSRAFVREGARVVLVAQPRTRWRDWSRPWATPLPAASRAT